MQTGEITGTSRIGGTIDEIKIGTEPFENLEKEELGRFDENKTFTERLQRKTDKFVLSARELSSRGMSFLIAMLGVILQASHTSLLMYDVSGFTSTTLRVLVALGIGIFISSALAIFTIKSNGKDQKIIQIVNIFFYFEVFTNIFYYFNSLIFSKIGQNWDMSQIDNRNWIYLIVAIPFAVIVPFAIKQFSGIISADDKLSFGSIEGPPEVLVDLKSEELEQLTSATKNINELLAQNESMKLQINALKDYSQEVINLKASLQKNYVKRGETILIDNDGKKSQLVIK